jgi:hypothetical protein
MVPPPPWLRFPVSFEHSELLQRWPQACLCVYASGRAPMTNAHPQQRLPRLQACVWQRPSAYWLNMPWLGVMRVSRSGLCCAGSPIAVQQTKSCKPAVIAITAPLTYVSCGDWPAASPDAASLDISPCTLVVTPLALPAAPRGWVWACWCGLLCGWDPISSTADQSPPAGLPHRLHRRWRWCQHDLHQGGVRDPPGEHGGSLGHPSNGWVQ